MKTIFTIFALLCYVQLKAQLFSIPAHSNYTAKNNISISLDRWKNVGVNYQRRLIQKGKFGIWGNVGVSSVISSAFRPAENTGYTIGYVTTLHPVGFHANIGVNVRWNMNEAHSLEFGAFVRRYQFYKNEIDGVVGSIANLDKFSTALDFGYRFQPKGKNWNMSMKYVHSFREYQLVPAPLKIGIGYSF